MDEDVDKTPMKKECNNLSETSNNYHIKEKQELTPFFEKHDHSVNVIYQSEVSTYNTFFYVVCRF